MKTNGLDFSRASFANRTLNQAPHQIPIFGSEIMSEPECVEYRIKMRTLSSDSARELFRLEHDQRMKLRAAEIGAGSANMVSESSKAGLTKKCRVM